VPALTSILSRKERKKLNGSPGDFFSAGGLARPVILSSSIEERIKGEESLSETFSGPYLLPRRVRLLANNPLPHERKENPMRAVAI
jgi:hypothetical protein